MGETCKWSCHQAKNGDKNWLGKFCVFHFYLMGHDTLVTVSVMFWKRNNLSDFLLGFLYTLPTWEKGSPLKALETNSFLHKGWKRLQVYPFVLTYTESNLHNTLWTATTHILELLNSVSVSWCCFTVVWSQERKNLLLGLCLPWRLACILNQFYYLYCPA